MLRSEEVVLPQHGADDTFFLHGDGWLQRWQVITVTQSGCLLQLRSWYPCGYDYTAQLCYQLETSSLHASLTLTHCGEQPMIYGCGFHPFFAFDKRSTAQFTMRGYWPENSICRWNGNAISLQRRISCLRNTVRIAG